MEDFDHDSFSRSMWWAFIKKHWPIYVVGVFTVLLTNIAQVLVTRNLGWILDFFSGARIPAYFSRFDHQDTFYVLFGILFGTRVLLMIGRVGWRMTLARMTHHSAAMMRRKIWDNVRFMKRIDLDSTYTKGVLMSASTSDVNSARFIYGFTLVALVDFVFLGLLCLVTMLSIHVPMSLWALGVLLLLPFAVKKLSALEMERYSKAQDYLADFNDLAAQVVSTIRLQRLTQTGHFWERRLLGSADGYRKRRLSAVFTSLVYIPITGGASILSYIVLFILGINYVMTGEMTVGDFIAMQGMIFLLQDPLFELGFIISEFKKSFTSMARLSEIYNRDKDESLLIVGAPVGDHDTVLDVEGLFFTHPDSERPLINNFNLKLRKGERLGISGPIGTGKSTLLKILSGLERKVDGRLKFLGQDFDDFHHEGLRGYIGYVPQKPFLFASSIRENVCMDRDISDEEIWYYLRLAGLDQDVKNFKNGLDTPLGEWGINLSGGQKQRMTLARALARKPKLLFLDDCLSAVDTVTEDRILKNLDEELKETTLIWVAHRKSTLKYCHQLLELK